MRKGKREKKMCNSTYILQKSFMLAASPMKNFTGFLGVMRGDEDCLQPMNKAIF